jgi:site-specific DNA-cytosine methylase
MIGSVAPNHGVSPATSNELQKPTDHAQTKGPHKVRFVELCSCLGSFTSKLTKLGANLLGFAEPSQEPVDLFKHKFPSARATDDLYDLTSFKAWITDFGEVDLLVLGPSCKSFSAAGKQDWSNPRATHRN